MLDASSLTLLDLLKNADIENKQTFLSQIEEIKEERERSGKPILEILENFGLFKKADILEIIAESLGTEVWEPAEYDVMESVIKMVDDVTARSYGIIPVNFQEGNLYVAMRDALDFQAVDALSFILNHHIIPLVADPDIIDRQMLRYYPEREEDIDDIIAEMHFDKDIVVSHYNP